MTKNAHMATLNSRSNLRTGDNLIPIQANK